MNVLSSISENTILYMPDKSGKPKIRKESVAAFWVPPSNVAYPVTAYEVTNEKIEGSGNLWNHLFPMEDSFR
ncbi:MAG: hypothetical protein HUU01_03220 [Saprospiraceae bacterium]|nr:hypothetical protein [Saprospiraceae bacterium]